MNLDRNGLEVLSRRQCVERLGRAAVGRVVFVDGGMPTALPVNFALLAEDIVFRTATGSKLAAALAKAVVTFECDDIDAVLQTGWSVLVHGWATLLTRPDDVARASALPLQPWAPGDRWYFVRIRSETVSGRQLVSRPLIRAHVGGLAGGRATVIEHRTASHYGLLDGPAFDASES